MNRFAFLNYDARGNLTHIEREINNPDMPMDTSRESVQKLVWDEEDRLLAVDLRPESDRGQPHIAAYTYDAGGERGIRYVPRQQEGVSSGTTAGYAQDMDIMLYPNALITVRPQELPEDFDPMRLHPSFTFTTYTKHYYIGSERINSKLGTIKDLGILCEQVGGYDLLDEMNTRVLDAGKRLELLYNDLGKDLRLNSPYLYSREHQIVCNFKSHNPELYDAYWYHPDHLGSSSFITNTTGEISQHLEYLPFGETLVEEHLNSYNSPFKFNAKEYDAETGNYYYGARYLNPKWSTFLTPDPALESYPSISPYAYTLNNPVRYVDPTGMFVESRDDIILKGKNGNTITIPTADDNHRYIDLPFNLSESQTFDLGLGNINTNNLAVGYSIGLSAGASATVGSTGSANITVVNFPTSSEYNDYNYVFAGYEYTYGGGTQLQVSANIEANFFVAYSNINGDRTPASFEGKASTYGLAFDIKAAKGGGISFYGFQTEDKYWTGVGVSLNVGVGKGANFGAWFKGESNSIMLNNQIPTKQRSFFDRVLNKGSNTTMIPQAIYQYINK